MNNPDRLQTIEELFHAALALEPSARAAFLTEACAGDAPLRAEVESLLSAHSLPLSLMDAPALQELAQAAAEMIGEQPTQPQVQSLAGQAVSHYRIEAPLGRGGMGEVWLAVDTALGRHVALKLLPPEFTQNDELVRRFELEARAASALNHPNIITIYEIGVIDGLHFIATEYIQGDTLRRRLRNGRLSVNEALEIVIQVAAALQAAHEAGIIHRDIKPENIMVRPDGYVKVLDFGLARISRTDQQPGSPDSQWHLSTQPGVIMGTLSYLSPEQARGQRVDARTDIWSLGVVLYELLTGVRPFGGATTGDIFVSILDREPPPLTDALPEAPAELQYIVSRALAKNSEKRYRTIQEMARDLREFHRGSMSLPAHSLSSVSSFESAEDPTLAFGQKHTASELPLQTAPKSSPAPAAASALISGKSSRRSAQLIAIALIALLATAFLSWRMLRTENPGVSVTPGAAALSERSMTWWLTVQKTREGRDFEQPFESAGQNIYEGGYKFRFNFTSPQAGFLYLLNEGPAEGGAITFNYLFPTPASNDGSAQLAAGQRIQTRQYVFDENKGTEKFWLIWAAQPVSELEALKGLVNPRDKGIISNQAQINALRAWLGQHPAAQSTTDEASKQTTVKGSGDVLVKLIRLEHQ
ncbi:MAG TPA: serine/threonine-protein kinase [Blastocatellia bacterium]|nr:serine/threonine-protein kinase [Blastocatellia bacterium]